MAASTKGRASDGLDGTAGETQPRINSKKSSPFRWTVGLVVRLCIWYALLTPFFRCPSHLSELNASSPRVCKPYLVARSYVEPHVVPYYDTYAAPYVDAARPYAHILNERVYTPAASVAKQGYDRYGAPALDQAQTYGRKQWEAQVAPRWETAKGSANDLYAAQVAPHVERVVTVASPYYSKANAAVITVYGQYIVPFYTHSQPFIGKTYSSGQDMLVTTVLPYAQSTWSSMLYFANSSLWPKVTGLYSENVEPQLVKIGQRLASYREGKQLRKVVEEVDSTEQPAPATSSSVEAKKAGSSTTSTTTTQSEEPTQTLSPAEQSAIARQKIESDLQKWQEKFAVAADKAAEDLSGRVRDIVESYMATEAEGHGRSLGTALNTVIEHEITNIKSRISALAESLPDEDAPEEEAAAHEELVKEIRQSAMAIRERAHAIREWFGSFDNELLRRVDAAVNSTLDVLDSVRDLGLQEIGMRWAWMDDVTYKDWARYHALKEQFEDWKGQFNSVGRYHVTMDKAASIADRIVQGGMEAAEDAAEELVRLRDVGKWKISAREVSDNFDTRAEPPPPRPKPSVEPSSEEAENETENETAKPSEGGVAGSSHESENSEQDHAPETSDDDDNENISADEKVEQAEEASARPAGGVAAAQVVDNKDTTEPQEQLHGDVKDASETAKQEKPQGDTAEVLISRLLADKDSAFAEDVLEKLRTMYGTLVADTPANEVSSAVDSAYSKATSAASAAVESQRPSNADGESFESAKGAVESVLSSAASAVASEVADNASQQETPRNDL